MTTATRPRRSNTDHITIDLQTGNFLCQHCGATANLVLPAAVSVVVIQCDEFTKEHRRCPKTWTPPPAPVADPTLGQQERITWWLKHGEHGTSSQTMVEVITGIPCTKPPFGQSHPRDPDDFRRCHLLLQAVPELRTGFPTLAASSPVWAELVQHWDELTILLEENIRTDTDNGMYARMKALGC